MSRTLPAATRPVDTASFHICDGRERKLTQDPIPVYRTIKSAKLAKARLGLRIGRGSRQARRHSAVFGDHNFVGLLASDPVQWDEGPRLAGNHDEAIHTCDPFDLLACLGADETGAQECSARRQLRADRPYCRRQTGLLDEMRDFASACAAAASSPAASFAASSSAGRGRAGSASATGSSSQRNFRPVLRGKAAGRIGVADPFRCHHRSHE
jgi:hypothetical protein